MSGAADHDLRDWQLDLVDAVVRQGVTMFGIRGGIGSGKSAGLVFLAHVLAATRPGCEGAIVMDSFARLCDVHLPLCQAIFQGATMTNPQRPEFRWPNGSTVKLRYFRQTAGQGLGQNPTEGMNLHFSLIDECQVFPDARPLLRISDRTRIPWADLTGRMHEAVVGTCGIPVAPAWWIDAVEEAGALMPVRTYFPTSEMNRAALSAAWFERQRALLGPDEYDALINNRPMPPVGQVLSNWRADTFPDGNLVDGWRPDPSRMVTVALDFGLRRPSVLFLQFDPTLDAWVTFRELHPDNTLTPELAARILEVAWPRAWRDHAPPGRLLFDEVICDPAGVARNVQTGISDIDLLAEPPPKGLGIRAFYETEPARRFIPAGVIRLRRLIGYEGRRRLLMTREMWDEGVRAPQKTRSLAKSIQGYRYPDRGGNEPLKDGINDHAIDALRYFAVRHGWDYDHPLDGRLPDLSSFEARPSLRPAWEDR